MKTVKIYTDGACSGNPGPGGWGAILRYGTAERELSGGEPETTNNRMELLAAISALRALKEPCRVQLFTDSQYFANALNLGWLREWKKKGWKRKGGELKNLDLWQALDELLDKHSVTVTWVRGHADNEYNNRCDAIAVAEREKYAT
jgi:ribonuclease HI